MKVKPTTIIALDPHAAALCESVHIRMGQNQPALAHLVQAHALTIDQDGNLKFEPRVGDAADSRFDLTAARTERRDLTAADGAAAIERDASKLEPLLIHELGAGRQTQQIESARLEGIEIVRHRLIYLVLSASDPTARGLVLTTARLIRWLYLKRFAQDLYNLHAIVMLPGLFAEAQPEDHAETYALLKTLDHALTKGIVISAQQKMPPFDFCWLIDRTNSRGDQMGMLPNELETYRDSFIGFLTSEPEMSGALTGTRTSRGKVPAYSTFGYGELFFPSTIAIQRLSSRLACEILTRGYLGAGTDQTDNHRRLLLMSKQFVLAPAYNDALNGFERKTGALIWNDFKPPGELERESLVHEHVSDLQRRFGEFERENWPAFQRELVSQGETVKKALMSLLDSSVDQIADASPHGLSEAYEFIQKLVDPGIALRADALGENPQNLITELRRAEGMLDQKLSLTIDDTGTQELLAKVNDLRSNLARLETALRLLRPESRAVSIKAAAASSKSEPSTRELITDTHSNDLETSSSEDYEKLVAEIENTKNLIDATCDEYQRALVEEHRSHYEQRKLAREQMRKAKEEGITALETEVTKLADQLGEARIRLDELQQERRAFLMRHFVWYPVLAALLLLIPVLGALIGVAVAGTLIALLVANTLVVLTLVFLVALPYTIAVLYVFFRGIDRQVKEARERVNSLESGLKTAATQLGRARNDRLRLEYDLYAQGIRIETFNQVIDTARQSGETLEQKMRELKDSCADFASEHEKAVPLSSMTRRSVLTAADIDQYFSQTVTDLDQVAAKFLEQVPRSLVHRLPLEEFRSRVEVFAQDRFRKLADLSIEDVLLRERELLPSELAPRKVRELDDAAQPLLQLRDIGVDGDVFAQRDVTIWVGAEDQRMLELYRSVNALSTMRNTENRGTLRTLSRCLNFPAYSLGQVEFYRACYDRQPTEDSKELPDLIPDELTVGIEVRQAYEQLLLALAIGVVHQTAQDQYSIGDRFSLTGDRKSVAEKLGTDFKAQDVYAVLLTLVKKELDQNNDTFKRLTDFLANAKDLQVFEREILDSLARKYNPLR